MNYFKNFIVISIILLISISGCKKKDNAAEEMQTETSKAGETTKPDVKWIFIEENTWIPVLDELGEYLYAAQQEFKKKETAAAAKHLREAAAFLKNEAPQADETGKEALSSAVTDLEKLAGDVESGKITSEKQLEPAFKKAYNADIEYRWVGVEEDYWIPYVEEPEKHFSQANENYLHGKMKLAAQDLREGAVYLKNEAVRAKGDSKYALNSSINELELLAGELDNNVKITETDLRLAIARAHHALAMEYKIAATESWAKKETEKAGKELNAAAYHLERASAWSKQEAKSGTTTMYQDYHLLAGKLIEGKGYAADEVEKTLKQMDAEIEKIGKEIEARQPSGEKKPK